MRHVHHEEGANLSGDFRNARKIDVKRISGCTRHDELGMMLEGKRLDLSKPGMTRMMCSPESMKAEAAFTGMLAQVRFATESEKGLTLWNEAGAEIVTLTEVSGGI